MFQVIVVFLPKGAITDDLNAIKYSLGNFAWGRQIPCLMGNTENTEGFPKSLRDLTRGGGCQKHQVIRLSVTRVGTVKCVSLGNFHHAEGEQRNCNKCFK